MSISNNPILTSDGYKYSHFMQYPQDTTAISSYISARGSSIPGCDEIVVLGLQSTMQDYLSTPITMAHIDEAERFIKAYGLPFNREGWERIVKCHGGLFPVKITAVPEGTVVPVGNMILQIENLDSSLPWVTSFLERKLLTDIWYPTTVASVSRAIKKIIKSYLDLTSDNADAEIGFKLHDFGFRGVSSDESAARGGFAHLTQFFGTDTVAGITHAMDFYNADVCGSSISASEHSTMTSWGREGEADAYANMVQQYAKKGAIFACVIDSYDTMAAIDMWADTDIDGFEHSLLDLVEMVGATVVLRPDSGDPVQMPIDVILKLMDKVGYTTNSKGFKVLPSHVRVIQGDGIDIEDVREILKRMSDLGLSASNIAFGMGGGLLQKVNRDTFKFAMKASARCDTRGQWHDVCKDPITDSGKKSFAGRLMLLRNNDGEYKTVRFEEGEQLRKEGWYKVNNTVYWHVAGSTKKVLTDMYEIRERSKL